MAKTLRLRYRVRCAEGADETGGRSTLEGLQLATFTDTGDDAVRCIRRRRNIAPGATFALPLAETNHEILGFLITYDQALLLGWRGEVEPLNIPSGFSTAEMFKMSDQGTHGAGIAIGNTGASAAHVTYLLLTRG